SPVPVLDGLVLQPTQAIPDPVVGLLLRQAQVINLLDGLGDGARLIKARERREGRLPESGHVANVGLVRGGGNPRGWLGSEEVGPRLPILGGLVQRGGGCGGASLARASEDGGGFQ